LFFLTQGSTKKINNTGTMIPQRIHQTGMDPVMAQPHNDQASFNKDFLDYVLEKLIDQPNNSFNRLSSFLAAPEASMQFSAVLPMGGSGIGSRSYPLPYCNSNTKPTTSPT
jgi:hypothetical protein